MAQSNQPPDLSVFEFSDIGAPRPDVSIYARFTVTYSTTALTPDIVFYRGSVKAGTASEFYRQAVTFNPWDTIVVNSPKITLNEGDIISVCIDPDRKLADRNRNNNCETRTVSAKVTDLTAATADISISPVGANVGEPVRVNATIRNNSDVAATTLVRLFHDHPNSPAAQQLGAVKISVPARGSAVASWNTVRPAGSGNFFVSADDVLPRDLTPYTNIACRNVFLKAIVDTGRRDGYRNAGASFPAVGDLNGDGQPVIVFAEYPGGGTANAESRVTALQIYNDGTKRELWSRTLIPSPSEALSPALVDLDGDGSPEVVVEAVKFPPQGGDGEIWLFALNKDGSTKWSKSWKTIGRASCHRAFNPSVPALGDMNGDGVVDVVVLEAELVVLDGRNGGELMRKPGIPNRCSSGAYSAIADLDGDGKPEFIAGDFGMHVFKNDGTILWEGEGNNIYNFALVDTDKDGKPEIVIPVHRQRFDILDARTGALKARNLPSNSWSPFDSTIGVTTSLDPQNYPSIAIANNDYANGTGMLDNKLGLKWFDLTPTSKAGITENPSFIALADLLGQGRPQVISRSYSYSFGLQDSLTGQWLEYPGIFGQGYIYGWPIPVDVDGDGHGEVIVSYGTVGGLKGAYDPSLPPAQFLIFGSDHWKKIPYTWNQKLFVPNQVDKKLAFRHDYQPWKTHNTWFQQPMRKVCDIDYDDDVDQNDINLIFAARGQAATANDWRDVDKDGQITVADARACTAKCTLANCTVINPDGRILSVGPRSVFPGATVNVTVRGEFLSFRQGTTMMSFGPGVSVGGAAAGAFGPVTVVDTDTAIATISVQPGQTGDRTLTVQTGTITASRNAALSLSAGNLPPAVTVSPSQTLILPGSVTVTGTVKDDGLPNGKLTYSWMALAGPGTVTFSNPNSLSTSVSFSKDGFYTLRLAATDGQYFASADTGVTVILGNQAPYVSAGANVTVKQDQTLTLKGDVQDDGLPVGATVTSQWAMVSGPGTVNFTNPAAPVTNANFSVAGQYVLSLTATDGQLSNSATVTVTVEPPLPRILSISPDSGVPGQTRTVMINGRFTNFVNGKTQASFGPGVSVGGGPAGGFGPVTVVDATTATVQVAIAAGATLGSRDIVIVTGAEQAAKSNAFIVGTVGVPYSIRPNLSDVVIAPGGSITATPEVIDAAGNTIVDASQTFTLMVTPKQNLAMGNTPVVSGLTASFPKLVKRLLNQDVQADPNGEYTDGDPADPNYGKETGGLYTLSLKLNGTAVTASVDIAVIPSGTASITLAAGRLINDVGSALDAVRNALAAGNVQGAVAARAQFTNVLANVEYSPKVLSNNNVLAPVNGFPASVAQVASAFPAGADDASFGKTLDAIVKHLQLTRARIDSLSAATISQADIDALRSAANTYKTLSQQLDALQPGPLGVTQSGELLNWLITRELPLLMNSITRKSAELLAALPSQSLAPVSVGTAREAVHGGISTAGTVDQLLTTFSNLFSIFTDLKGYAKGNLIELGISLANDLVNIALANKINSLNVGDMAVDFVSAGGQFSFVCPNWQNTYVEGSGFSADVTKNAVAVIGCINSYALRSLLTLKPAKDYAASIRLFFKIKSLAEAMGRDQSIAANVDADSLREGLFGGTQMVFNLGWPRVNQGRLPCVGIVITFNFESGAFQAVNANLLPTCGN